MGRRPTRQGGGCFSIYPMLGAPGPGTGEERPALPSLATSRWPAEALRAAENRPCLICKQAAPATIGLPARASKKLALMWPSGWRWATPAAAHFPPCQAAVLTHATCFSITIPVEATCALWLSALIRPRGNVLDSWLALRSALLASHYQPKHSNLRPSPDVWRNRSLHRSMATPNKRLLAPHTSGEISNTDVQARFPLSLFPEWEGPGLRRPTFDP